MSYPTLPLVVQRDIEQQKTWEGISTPYELALWLAKIMSIDPTRILQLNEIIHSDVQPVGSDASKIWIKTDEPLGVGLPTGGGYRMIYQYPPNTPFLYIGTIPTYTRELSLAEMQDYSLTAPTSANATWVIYEV